MRDPHSLRSLLGAATVLAGLALVTPGCATGADAALADSPTPPEPDTATVEDASHVLAKPLNQPATGASISPAVVGGQSLLSLESLQAARPGLNPSGGMSGARGEALHEAALSNGGKADNKLYAEVGETGGYDKSLPHNQQKSDDPASSTPLSPCTSRPCSPRSGCRSGTSSSAKPATSTYATWCCTAAFWW